MSMAEHLGFAVPRFMTTTRKKPEPAARFVPLPPAILSTTSAANQALASAIEYAKPYGHVKAIAAALSELTGQSVTRQMVGRWLNSDPEKRIPIGNFGMGLALLFVVARLQDPEATTAEFTIEVPSHKKTRKTKAK